MKDKTILSLAVLLATSFSAAAQAQAVYRCKLGDGAVIFSDLPCQSDIGEENMVDATPHQGHRSSPAPGAPAYKKTGESDAGARRHRGDGGDRADAAGYWKRDDLTYRQRVALERERKALLSALKRRHIAEREKKAVIGELREIDGRLGLGPGDVPDMPFHDRDVYEEHNIYPGRSRASRE